MALPCLPVKPNDLVASRGHRVVLRAAGFEGVRRHLDEDCLKLERRVLAALDTIRHNVEMVDATGLEAVIIVRTTPNGLESPLKRITFF